MSSKDKDFLLVFDQLSLPGFSRRGLLEEVEPKSWRGATGGRLLISTNPEIALASLPLANRSRIVAESWRLNEAEIPGAVCGYAAPTDGAETAASSIMRPRRK